MHLSLFKVILVNLVAVMLCIRLEKCVHIRLHGVDHPRLLFELCSLIIEPLLLVEKTLLFGLKGLQARQFFFSLHGKQRTLCRLKDHKLGRMIIGLVLLAIGVLSFRKGRGWHQLCWCWRHSQQAFFRLRGRVSLIENRKCGYTCCACYSLKSYSIAEIPRKIPLHITTDSLLGFVRD